MNYRWFNANHVHGTIMPRQSSINAPVSDYMAHAASNGSHKTVRNKDTRKAAKQKNVRVGYEARTRYWATDDVEMADAE
jgi:hypothetical protein